MCPQSANPRLLCTQPPATSTQTALTACEVLTHSCWAQQETNTSAQHHPINPPHLLLLAACEPGPEAAAAAAVAAAASVCCCHVRQRRCCGQPCWKALWGRHASRHTWLLEGHAWWWRGKGLAEGDPQALNHGLTGGQAAEGQQAQHNKASQHQSTQQPRRPRCITATCQHSLVPPPPFPPLKHIHLSEVDALQELIVAAAVTVRLTERERQAHDDSLPAALLPRLLSGRLA